MKHVFESFEAVLKRSSSFQQKYEGYHILKYGSSINGLCSKLSSDLDITIISEFEHPEIILRDVTDVIKKYGYCKYNICSPPRKDRAGWILNLLDVEQNMEIDLMVNKISEVLNS
jgi:hypothetical protein